MSDLKPFFHRMFAAVTVVFSCGFCWGCKGNTQPTFDWRTHYNDARMLDIQKNRAAAIKQYRSALTKVDKNEREWRADILARMARLYVLDGKIAEADKMTRQSLAIALDKSAQSDNHGELLVALDDLAETYSEQSYKSKDNRIVCLDNAIRILDRPFGDRQSNVLRRSQRELATIYILKGDDKNAEPLITELLEDAEKRNSITAPVELAAAYHIAGRSDKEYQLTSMVFLMYEKPQARLHAKAKFIDHLATLYVENGQYDKAEKTIVEWIENLRNEADIHMHSQSLTKLATIYEAKGELNDAEKYHQNACAMERKSEKKKYLALALDAYSRFLKAHGREKEAVPLDKEALRYDERSF